MPSKMIHRVREHDDLLGMGKHLGWAKHKAVSLVGAAAPTTPDMDKWKKLKACGASVGVGAVAGGAAGYYLWKKHEYLGALTGAMVGVEAAAVHCGVGVDWLAVAGQAGAVLGSLNWRKHPVWGYLLGGAAARVAGGVVGLK